MAKFFVKLGAFNKIILIPFLLALAKIFIIIVEHFYLEERKNLIMDSFSMSFGHIAIIIIPYIKCFSLSNQKKKTKCQCSKKNILHYFILLILFSIDDFVSDYSSLEITEVKSFFYLVTNIITSREAIIIILITILAKLLLKYEYFIHHYLSIGLFVVFSISIDLILDSYSNFSKIDTLELIFNFVSIISKVLYLCYIKYMIDRHYHYYWNIGLSHGILQLIVISFFLIYIFIVAPKGKKPMVDIIFYDYFTVVPLGIIISKFIINCLLQFLYNALQILTIFYLSPEFVLISDNIARILYFFLNFSDNYKLYICIIFFILQFFSLMIYLEIFELNFLNLNKNTKRNIKLRVDDEQNDRLESLDSGKFEMGDGYIFNNEEKDEKEGQSSQDHYIVELKHLQSQNEDD